MWRSKYPRLLLSALLVSLLAGNSWAETNLQEWELIGDDADGWKLGWNGSPEASISDVEPVEKVGLGMTMAFSTVAWGDANMQHAWINPQAPNAVRVRLLVPVGNGIPKGPMSMGCALNIPTWSEAKDWVPLRFKEKVSIEGKDYLAQTVTCKLGDAQAAFKALILRFGGENVRFKGTMYIQKITALAN